MKSCKDCPSFVSTDDVPVVFGRAVGAPMCKRYSYVLGRPGLSESGTETAQQAFALACDSFGEPAPDKPVDTRTRVVNPDEVVIVRAGEPSFTPDELSTCRQCTNLVRSDVVHAELGFPNDLCRAKGKLIFRPQNECQGCPWAQKGLQSTTTDGLELRAEFKEGFVLPSAKIVEAVTSLGSTTDEPTTYETDKPVTSDEEAMGVRAWRRIQDPDGFGEDQWLPIMRPDIFSDDELALIPRTGDSEHFPELYIDYANILYSFATDVVSLGETLVLQGRPGVGKTEAAYWLAWLMQVPVHRFTFTKDTDVDDMIGTTVAEGGNTRFILGRIPEVYMRPAVIVYDELNLAPEEVREFLRPTFDNAKQLVIDRTAPAIRCPKHKFNFPMIAQNPAWDIRNIGTTEMALADYDRLSVQTIDLPPEAIERHIIRTKVLAADGWDIPEHLLTEIMGIATDIREFEEQGSIPFNWGIRQQIKVARKARYYRLPKAYRRAALDFYEPAVVEEVFQAIGTRLEED